MTTKYLSGDTITVQCVYTKSGVLADPTTAPAVALYLSGTLVGTAGTATKISTGIYQYKHTLPDISSEAKYVSRWETVDDDGDAMVDKIDVPVTPSEY